MVPKPAVVSCGPSGVTPAGFTHRAKAKEGRLAPPHLLDHDAVGARQLEAAGEVEGVHPAQHQREDHDRQVGLDASQVESSCHQDQDGIDEAAGGEKSGRASRLICRQPGGGTPSVRPQCPL